MVVSMALARVAPVTGKVGAFVAFHANLKRRHGTPEKIIR